MVSQAILGISWLAAAFPISASIVMWDSLHKAFSSSKDDNHTRLGLPLMTPSYLIISAPFVQGRSPSQVVGFKVLAYILEDTIQPTLQIMRKMFSFKSVLFTFSPKKLGPRSLK